MENFKHAELRLEGILLNKKKKPKQLEEKKKYIPFEIRFSLAETKGVANGNLTAAVPRSLQKPIDAREKQIASFPRDSLGET